MGLTNTEKRQLKTEYDIQMTMDAKENDIPLGAHCTDCNTYFMAPNHFELEQELKIHDQSDNGCSKMMARNRKEIEQ